jgi:hypothetical protein
MVEERGRVLCAGCGSGRVPFLSFGIACRTINRVVSGAAAQLSVMTVTGRSKRVVPALEKHRHDAPISSSASTVRPC